MRCICTWRGAETTTMQIDALIAAGLQQQRDVEDHGASALPPGARDEGTLLLPHHWVQDRLQPGQRFRFAQHRLTQRRPVHRAVAHRAGKRRRDRVHRPAATRLQSVHRCIRVEYRDARPAERRGGRRLPHADAAGQAEDDHRVSRSATTNWRSSSSTARFDAEPGVEAGHRLMKQHAETFHAAKTAAAGRRQQRRFQRHIDVVGHHQRGRRARQIEIERLVPDHAQRRGVHHQRMVGECRSPGVPFRNAQPGQIAGQCLGAATGAVGHRHGRAGVQQRRRDRTRRAAGAQQQRRAGRRVHAMGAEIGDEAIAVGVAAGDPALSEHQRVDRAGAAGGVVHGIADVEGGELVRDGDIGAGEPGRQQPAHRDRELAVHGSARGCRRRRCHGAAARTRAGAASGNT